MKNLFLLILICSLFIGCTKKQPEAIFSNNEIQNTTQTDLQSSEAVTEPVVENQIDVDEIVATKESLSKYYVSAGDEKIYVEGVLSSNEGIIYTINNTKIADKTFEFKTFIFNEETNTNTLLFESNKYGLSGTDTMVFIDGDFLIRFYKVPGCNYVDLYNYKKDSYIYTGYDKEFSLDKHLLTIGLSRPLSPEDEEKVAPDFENYDYGNLPEDYIPYLKKSYVYEINYFTNEINLIKGDYELEL